MRRSGWTVVSGALVAVLVAGCAATVAGTAEPDPAGISTGFTSTAPTSTGAPSTGAMPTGQPPATSPTTRSAATSRRSSIPAQPAPPDSAPPGTTSSSNPAHQRYPTTPLTYRSTPSTTSGAHLLEARRIAAALVVPTFVDPAYTGSTDLSTVPLRDAAAMSILFPPPVPSVAQQSGMITGFSSGRRAGQNALLVAAFEFGTEVQAAAAAKALAAASVDKADDRGRAVVAGFPAAVGQYGTLSESGAYFQSFLAQGRLVLYVYVNGPQQSSAEQARLAAKAFTVEAAAMAAFRPTPPDALMRLPVDPAGLLSHTLPNTGDAATVRDGFMTAAGQLHYDTDPAATRALFRTAGVDVVGDGRASLYRARDEAGAKAVRDGFVASVRKADSMQSYTLSAAVPSARCVQQALNSRYYCVGTRGRYAFEIQADSESDIAAAMDAQYRLLAGW